MPAYGALDRGYAGLVIYGEDNIDSLVCKESAGIAFGAPVFKTANIDDGAYNYASGLILQGVAVHTHKEYAGSGLYAQGDVVGVLNQGAIQVLVGAAVQATERAYWDSTNKVWTNVSSGNVATPYRFRTSAASGAIADLDVVKGAAALV